MTILYLTDKEKGFEEKQLDKFDLDTLTGLVEGPPEALYLPENIVLWKNPKAALLNQEKRLVLRHEGELGDYVHGPVAITGTDGTKTIALNDDQIKKFKEITEEVEVDGEKLTAVNY
ncbi:DUF3846 domain-containing protein [Alkalicoccus saliphilus]|jgi:hypothetical protein|uniref:DUF3846 domain-containing protein n=1 Tax=Alkalicoccus saliphilus TaxID=200989 RepID=A0A2T4U582_9BACI|nr:hypothetical protein [Alkalicoccus saliphilus]PTL38544.1 hypothetical protein C6Y45_10900 [Alkalicoccus saliphilus]